MKTTCHHHAGARTLPRDKIPPSNLIFWNKGNVLHDARLVVNPAVPRPPSDHRDLLTQDFERFRYMANKGCYADSICSTFHRALAGQCGFIPLHALHHIFSAKPAGHLCLGVFFFFPCASAATASKEIR